MTFLSTFRTWGRFFSTCLVPALADLLLPVLVHLIGEKRVSIQKPTALWRIAMGNSMGFPVTVAT